MKSSWKNKGYDSDFEETINDENVNINQDYTILNLLKWDKNKNKLFFSV